MQSGEFRKKRYEMRGGYFTPYLDVVLKRIIAKACVILFDFYPFLEVEGIASKSTASTVNEKMLEKVYATMLFSPQCSALK